MYTNEKEFSKALILCLRSTGAFVQRIESGITGKGIPDIYCIVGNTPYWLELKRVKRNLRVQTSYTIPWRVGQQSWLHAVQRRGQHAFTVVCFDNAILPISHEKETYPGNAIRSESSGFSSVRLFVEWLKKGATKAPLT